MVDQYIFLEHGFHDSRDLALCKRMVSLLVKITRLIFICASAKGEECIPQTWDMFYEK